METSKSTDFTYKFKVECSAEHAFKCINHVTAWWTENLEGHSQKLNDEFTVRFGNVHVSTQKIIEFIPNKKVVWLITESQLNFISDKQEWNGTTIIFEVNAVANQTQVSFIHKGLNPALECYGDCSNAWTEYVRDSLKPWVNIGEGNPARREK